MIASRSLFWQIHNIISIFVRITLFLDIYLFLFNIKCETVVTSPLITKRALILLVLSYIPLCSFIDIIFVHHRSRPLIMISKFVTFALVVLAVAMATVDAKKPEGKPKENKMPCPRLLELYDTCISAEPPRNCTQLDTLINKKGCISISSNLVLGETENNIGDEEKKYYIYCRVITVWKEIFEMFTWSPAILVYT